MNTLSSEMPTTPIPVGFCQCGCGQRTRIAERSRAKLNQTKGEPIPFVYGHQYRMEKSSKWRGGRKIHVSGYVQVYVPGHPRGGPGGYAMEHILVVERALGKPLRAGAVVHHVDECKTNNANSNLVACHDQAYHALLHQRQRSFQATGDPAALRCRLCGGYENQETMVQYRIRTGSLTGRHRACIDRHIRDQIAKKRQRSLPDILAERIGRRELPADVDRAALQALAQRYLADAEVDLTGQLVDSLQQAVA